MAIVKCEKGHNYNNSITPNCPYCSGGSVGHTIPLDGPGYDSNKPLEAEIVNSNVGKTQMLSNTPAAPADSVLDAIPATEFVAEPATGHTVLINPIASKSNSSDSSASQPVINAKKLPVVGWLVVAAGENIGLDLRVHSGVNSIGRLKSNDIAIEFDQTVSKENACSLVYDPKNNKFFITFGESKNIVYVNGSALLQPTEIKDYDEIEVGETKLVFRSLCNDKFNY